MTWLKRKLSCSTTKPQKWLEHPAKTQISLDIHPVWSESSLCAEQVATDPMVLHVDSEEKDQTERMPRLISVFAGRARYFAGFVALPLKYCLVLPVAVAERNIFNMMKLLNTIWSLIVLGSNTENIQEEHDETFKHHLISDCLGLKHWKYTTRTWCNF